MTIAMNVWRNYVRTRSRAPLLLTEHYDEDHGTAPADGSTSPDDLAAQDDAFKRLVAKVYQLPDHQRIPVMLRHVEDLSYSEIADALGCPVGTAKANASRGVARLRLLLQQDDAVGAQFTS